MIHCIKFKDFLDNVEDRCDRWQGWLDQSTVTSCEYQQEYGYHENLVSSWIGKIKLIAASTKVGRITHIQCLNRLLENGIHLIMLDSRMPDYMKSLIDKLTGMVLSNIGAMGPMCNILEILSEAVSEIRGVIDFIEDINCKKNTNQKLSAVLDELLDYMKKRLAIAESLAEEYGSHAIDVIIAESKCFGSFALGKRTFNFYISEISKLLDSKNICIREYLLSKSGSISNWYRLALRAYEHQAIYPIKDSTKIAVEEMNIQVSRHLTEALQALESMLSILSVNDEISCDDNDIRIDLIIQITEIASMVRLCINANFAFTENRRMVKYLTSIAIDAEKPFRRLHQAIRYFIKSANGTPIVHAEMRQHLVNAISSICKAYQEINKTNSAIKCERKANGKK